MQISDISTQYIHKSIAFTYPAIWASAFSIVVEDAWVGPVDRASGTCRMRPGVCAGWWSIETPPRYSAQGRFPTLLRLFELVLIPEICLQILSAKFRQFCGVSEWIRAYSATGLNPQFPQQYCKWCFVDKDLRKICSHLANRHGNAVICVPTSFKNLQVDEWGIWGVLKSLW